MATSSPPSLVQRQHSFAPDGSESLEVTEISNIADYLYQLSRGVTVSPLAKKAAAGRALPS